MDRTAPRGLGIDAVSGRQHPIDERAHGFYPDVHVGDLGLDHLKFGDRTPELLARPGVLDGELQRTLGHAQADRRDRGAFEIQARHHDPQAVVLGAQTVFHRHATVVEHQLARLATPEAHLAELLCDLEPYAAALDDERGHAMRTELRGSLGIGQQDVGDGTVGDVDLAAVEPVLIAVATRAHAHRAERIGAGTRFGERQGAEQRAIAQARQIATALGFIRVTIDIGRAEVVVREPGEGEGMIPSCHGLCDQPGAEQIEAGTAVALRHRDAQIAGRSESRERLGRPPLLVVHALGQWVELGVGVTISGVQNLALISRQFESRR